MWEKLIQIFKIKDLRNKIIFVLAMLIAFRLAANLPIPIIDSFALERLLEGQLVGTGNNFLNLLSIVTGGALNNLSIVMLGLGPYITATIIMQLLTMIFPALEAMYKEEGEAGRQKFNQYGRIITVPLAMLQSYAMIHLMRSQLGAHGVLVNITGWQIILAMTTITAGTVFLMWIGELISEKGIGNGVSLLIFAGIVARFPFSVGRVLTEGTIKENLPQYIGFLVIALVIIISVVIITEGRRNIPVSYAKRVRGSRIYGGVSTYLPLNVNPAGVIPIIFAISILLFPSMVGNFLAGAKNQYVSSTAITLKNLFAQPGLIYNLMYFLLVVLFTYFYTAVTFDPKNVAENLQKMGGFIPGIRPGKPTTEFLNFILNRVLLIGAVFLGLIAIAPFLIQLVTPQVTAFTIGGTSVLIVVAVVLETVRQIESQLVMREYEGF